MRIISQDRSVDIPYERATLVLDHNVLQGIFGEYSCDLGVFENEGIAEMILITINDFYLDGAETIMITERGVQLKEPRRSVRC